MCFGGGVVEFRGDTTNTDRQTIAERLLTGMFSPYISRLHGQDVPRRNRPMRLVAMSEWGNMRTERNTIPLWL